MSRHLERARLLLEQSRYELAETELRQALGDEPDLPPAHALLAVCLSHRKEHREATAAAERAVHLAPDEPFSHYVLACVLEGRDRHDEAERAVEEAIRLDPFDADYFALLSQTHVSRQGWTDALKAANIGLSIEADHVGCTNLRAIALVKLGRRSEAGRTIDAALARSPEDPCSHANMGWTLLEARQPQKAMEHFREALRLDPTSEWARAGIVEAMKARHFVYRWMLGFFLWMSRFSPRTQILLVVGLLVGQRVLSGLAKSIPALEPLFWPIVIGYVVFAVLTWIASPLFNLILRLDRFGRLALSREQTVQSNLLGSCLAAAFLVAAVPTGISLATRRPIVLDYPLTALLWFGLSLPVTGVFHCAAGWPRRVMVLIAVTLAALVAGSTLGVALDWPATPRLFETAVQGLVISTWAGMFLSAARVRK